MNSRAITQSIVLVATVAALFGTGCRSNESRSDASAANNLPSGYTCCNLHHSNDWINDANYAELPMIPAGTPVRITSWGRYRAYADIDGKTYGLGLDYGRTLETTEQWVNKIIVGDDPKARLASYSSAVRKAIQNGQVMIGMTKEQVIMSLGYPETDQNPRLDAEQWRYWRSSFGEYQVHWNHAERVSEITGHPETVTHMMAPGHASAPPPPAVKQEVSVEAPKPRKSIKSTKGVKNDAKSE